MKGPISLNNVKILETKPLDLLDAFKKITEVLDDIFHINKRSLSKN